MYRSDCCVYNHCCRKSMCSKIETTRETQLWRCACTILPESCRYVSIWDHRLWTAFLGSIYCMSLIASFRMSPYLSRLGGFRVPGVWRAVPPKAPSAPPTSAAWMGLISRQSTVCYQVTAGLMMQSKSMGSPRLLLSGHGLTHPSCGP